MTNASDMKRIGDFEELWKRARVAVYIQRRWLFKLREATSSLEEVARPQSSSSWAHFRSLVEEVRVYTEHVDDTAIEIEAILGG